MSSKNIIKNIKISSQKKIYTSNKKKSKNKKFFNYPKNKLYSKEIEFSPIENIKDKNLNFKNSKETLEYQGLIYKIMYPTNGIYYLSEKEPGEEFNIFHSKWKTEICRYWEMYGNCKYGENCAFAHGESELNQRKLTFNYKTKPCKQFFEFGYCSYGSRCQFRHKKLDNKTKKENISNNVSYLKIIEELLSEKNMISQELLKRPRLMTFENITHCSLEESEKSKLKLYEDFINLKNETKRAHNISFKLSDDTNSNSNVSSDSIYEKD